MCGTFSDIIRSHLFYVCLLLLTLPTQPLCNCMNLVARQLNIVVVYDYGIKALFSIEFNLAQNYVCLFNVESGHVLVCMYQSLAAAYLVYITCHSITAMMILTTLLMYITSYIKFV